MNFKWKNKSEDQIADFVMKQQGRLEDSRQVYTNLWSGIVKIFRPRRYDLLEKYNKGQQYGATVYDQRPANVLAKFVAGKLGYMVSRAVPWIQFVTPNRQLMDLDHIKRYCQDASEQILYAANRSNLYSALVPHALDAHSIGTSVMIPSQDFVKDRVHFDVVHPRDSYIAVDGWGNPSIYHRSLALTTMTIEELFGNDALPDDYYDMSNNRRELKDPLQEVELIWAVYPNQDRDSDSSLPADMLYKVFCIMPGRTGKTGKAKLLLNGGTPVFPVCWRSGIESGASYGTSICADCLTASLMMSKLGEKSITAAHLVVEPPLLISQTLKPSFSSLPGARNWTSDLGRQDVKSFLDRLSWPITDAQMSRLDEQLDDRFFIRFFEMLSTGDMKARTAYEVSQMMGEKATLMTTIVDTFEQESLEPAIDYLIYSESMAGRMPNAPPEIIQTGGRIDINYLGPLAQLQRSVLRSKGIIDSLGLIAQVMQLNPNAGWKINWLELIEEVTVSQGMPQKLILSDEEVSAIEQQVAQQQQLEQQALMAEKMSKVVPALSKKVDAGSPMEKMTEMSGAGV